MYKTNFTRNEVLKLMEYLDNRITNDEFDTYEEDLDYYVITKK